MYILCRAIFITVNQMFCGSCALRNFLVKVGWVIIDFFFFQIFIDEVEKHKTKVREATTAGKKLLRSSTLEDNTGIREKMDQLKHRSDLVASKAVERLNELEQALPLATSFHETHDDLVSWLIEVEPALAELEVITVDADQVKRQQEMVKVSTSKNIMRICEKLEI